MKNGLGTCRWHGADFPQKYGKTKKETGISRFTESGGH